MPRAEERAIECVAKHLFGGNYDLVRRVGLVGAYGFINGRPVTLLIRVEGSMNFNTASEFRRVYSFAQAGTVVILLRTRFVTSANFARALGEAGYRVVSITISLDDALGLALCDDDSLKLVLQEIGNALA